MKKTLLASLLFLSILLSFLFVSRAWGATCVGCANDKNTNGGGSGIPGGYVWTCFPAGTKILMSGGHEKNIEEVKIGDSVMGYDTATNKMKPATVQELDAPIRDHLYKLTFADGTTLRLTSEHPLYTKQGWRSINPHDTFQDNPNLTVTKLSIGDSVFTKQGTYTKLVSMTYIKGNVQTYNLKKVSAYNNFFADSYLAHNKGGGGGEDTGAIACIPLTCEAYKRNTCGLAAQYFGNGCGGYVYCPATATCCIPSKLICSSACGQTQKCVTDGCGGQTCCPVTAACPTPTSAPKYIDSATYNPNTYVITVFISGKIAATDWVGLYWSASIPPLALPVGGYTDWAFPNNLKTAPAANELFRNVITFQRKPTEFTGAGSFAVRYVRGSTTLDQSGVSRPTTPTATPTPSVIRCSSTGQCPSGYTCITPPCTGNMCAYQGVSLGTCKPAPTQAIIYCGGSKPTCPAGYTCVQPPMPPCPAGRVCPQAMPPQICEKSTIPTPAPRTLCGPGRPACPSGYDCVKVYVSPCRGEYERVDARVRCSSMGILRQECHLSACPLFPKGDANCDKGVNETDYDIFKSYLQLQKPILKQGETDTKSGTYDEGIAYSQQYNTYSVYSADFNKDGKVNVVDYEIWRNTARP